MADIGRPCTADAEEFPLERFLDLLLLTATRENASEIVILAAPSLSHPECRLRVLFRVDGEFQEIPHPPASWAEQIFAGLRRRTRMTESGQSTGHLPIETPDSILTASIEFAESADQQTITIRLPEGS